MLPAEYCEFLLQHNGGRPEKRLFPIRDYPRDTHSLLHFFFGIGKESDLIDIEWTIEAYQGRIPSNLLPIATDLGGNAICIGIDGERIGQIYFWDHADEEEVAENEVPGYYNVYFVANSLPELLASLTDKSISPSTD